jgi:lysophospholipase L1-like esterase
MFDRRAFLFGCCLVVMLPACFTSTVYAADNQSVGGRNLPAVNPAQIVLIGASYAKAWNPASLSGMKVINRGVGGEQTHEILARFDQDVVSARPRAVLIWGFINDIFRSNPDELKDKLDRSRSSIRSMADKARNKGITPVLATEVTLPASTGLSAWFGKLRGKQSYQAYVNGHVIEMNHWIRLLAAEKKLVLLDFEKVLADQDGARKREYTTEDGTHLSTKAYEALTRYAQSQKLPN